jgi:hypothetical protein
MLTPELIDIARQGAALAKALEKIYDIEDPASGSPADARATDIRVQIARLANKMIDLAPAESPSYVADQVTEMAQSGGSNPFGFLCFADAIRRAAFPGGAA